MAINFTVASQPPISFQYGEKMTVFNNNIKKISLDEFNKLTSVVSSKNVLYFIEDYKTDSEGTKYPGICVGDGSAYIGDLPISVGMTKEEQESVKNITDKVAVKIDDKGGLVFYK